MKKMHVRCAKSDNEFLCESLNCGITIDTRLVITAKHSNKKEQTILSYYGDSEWVFPDSLFSAGTSANRKKLNFYRLKNSDFVAPLKYAISRYYLIGLPGFRRPRGNTIRGFFNNVIPFFNFLESQNIHTPVKITPMIGALYVQRCKKQPGRNGKALSPGTLSSRFMSVEILQALLEGSEYSFAHPWPESSSYALSGWRIDRSASKTPIIPESIVQPMMRSAVSLLEKSGDFLASAELIAIAKDQGKDYPAINKILLGVGYHEGVKQLSKEVLRLQDACMLIILMTTGIRAHELLYFETGCAYKRKDEDSNSQFWVKGFSSKTYEGATEWLCPKLCHEAVAVAERIAQLLREKSTASSNPTSANDTENETCSQRLFLVSNPKQKHRVIPLSSESLRTRLKEFVKRCGLDWDFSPHQARRTFAVNVVRHVLGDLRYLKEHFKHWSLDMTALYAANQAQDRELYDEIYLAMSSHKHAKIEHWLEADTPISGGLGERIKVFRSKGEAVRTYRNQTDMVQKVSDTISLRATGVAWCTADSGGCNGGSGTDRTKCGDCDNSVIDDRHLPLWEAIYVQQIELIQLDDIGEQGRQVANRALKCCEKVLSDLGADVNKLKQKVGIK